MTKKNSILLLLVIVLLSNYQVTQLPNYTTYEVQN
jgi:hypothetical protein